MDVRRTAKENKDGIQRLHPEMIPPALFGTIIKDYIDTLEALDTITASYQSYIVEQNG